MYRRTLLNRLLRGIPLVGVGCASLSAAYADGADEGSGDAKLLHSELANGGRLKLDANLIGVRHSGGSIDRPLLSKLADTISVKDFGAQGCGGDDTVAIQEALEYAGSVQNQSAGGTVLLPKGDYRIAVPLTVPDKVHFVGEGYSSILRTMGPQFKGACMIDLGGEGQNVFDTRIIGMRLHQHGGVVQKAIVYSESMNQQCGVFDVLIDGLAGACAIMFVAGRGTNGPSIAEINNVTVMVAGDVTSGIYSNVGGMILKVSHVTIEAAESNKIRHGVNMVRDILAADSMHFEGCTEGITIGQESFGGSGSVITGHSTTGILVSIHPRFSKGGVNFDCLLNRSLAVKGLTVLENLRTNEVYKDMFLTSYSYTAVNHD